MSPARFRSLFLVLLASLCFWCQSAGEVPADAVLDAELAAMDAHRLALLQAEEAPLRELARNYRDAIERQRVRQRSAGNLEGVRAADRELARLAAGDDSPELPDHPEVARLRRNYLAEKARVADRVEIRRVAIEREHALALEEMVATLTREDRIEQAIRVNAIREALVTDFAARRVVPGRLVAGSKRVMEIAPGVFLTLCWIPSGEFLMGSPADEAERRADGMENQVKVNLTQPFWLAETEVTQAQWLAVMGTDPSRFKGIDRPVERVSWHDAQEFIAKLNDAGGLPEGWRWSLPTEAQWEYACRAGTRTAYAFGDTLTPQQANFAGTVGQTRPVGSYPANAWDLRDMHGNVWEWCLDSWDGSTGLPGGADPVGREGELHVVRGGSWRYVPADCRSAFRYGFDPGSRFVGLGFRPSLVPSK